VLWPLGIGEGARRLIEEAIAHALKIKHIPTIAYAYVHAAIFEQMRRDRLRCMPYVQAYLDIAREHGMPQWLAVGAFHEGWVRWDAGNHEAGAAHIHSTLEQIRKLGVSVTTPLTGVLLAEAEAEAGCCDAALALVGSELETMMRTGECWYLAEAHRVRGELLLKARPANSEVAEEAFTHAISTALAV
jgi:predicted ATPase